MSDFPSRKRVNEIKKMFPLTWAEKWLMWALIEAMDLLELQTNNFCDLDRQERLAAEQRIEDILREWEK